MFEIWKNYCTIRKKLTTKGVIKESKRLRVLFSHDADCREKFDNICHHGRLTRVHGSGQKCQTILLSENPLQSILQTDRDNCIIGYPVLHVTLMSITALPTI